METHTVVYQIDTSERREKWQFACPHRKRHTSWRVTDGLFECLRCKHTYEYLIDLKTNERVYREEIQLVGTDADTKGEFGRPQSSE